MKPAANWDLRVILDDKEIDAVSIVTPNHWHALAAIWASQAGKHVYVEKPASHNIWEGRKMIKACGKWSVHAGRPETAAPPEMYARPSRFYTAAASATSTWPALCFKARDSYGMAKDSSATATFHYDRWLGPAPMRPYNEKRSHYNWHWYWDTGNGDTGNTGPHQLDMRAGA